MQTSHPEDMTKTRIRMEKTQMQELGIGKGDVVKITGSRSTYAFCFPWDAHHDNQNERNYVYLDDSSKNMPIVKISDLTYSNLRNFHFGNFVEVHKADAVNANKMTITPLIGAHDRKNFTLDWLEAQIVVCKGDHIVGKHDDPKRIPRFFVIDGSPPSEAWIIDKNTPIEISDKHPENLPSIIKEGRLNSVIPVVQQISGNDFEMTISAIEVYDNCMRIFMYVKDSIVHQEELTTSGLCYPTTRTWDDLGNQYISNRYNARGGGTQFGGILFGGSKDLNNFSEISLHLTPTIHKQAQELTLSVEQFMWDIRKHPPPPRIENKTKDEPIIMTPVSRLEEKRLEEKHVIHGGPWRIKIKLDKK